MAKAITARQSEVLDFIKRQVNRMGFPPTRREITEQFGFGSPNAAEEHLRALDRKGYIRLIRRTSRGIALTPKSNTATSPAANDVTVEGQMAIVGMVAAGSPIEYFEDTEPCDVSPNLFQPAADYLLQVRGLSMIKAGILDGDLLAVHRTNEVRNGQIVVARIDNEVTVKRYRLSDRPNLVNLEPENDDFDVITVDVKSEPERLTIEGISVGILRLNP